MIIALIIWILKKVLIPQARKMFPGLARQSKGTIKLILMASVVLCLHSTVNASETTVTYQIRYKDKVVGQMQLQQNRDTDKLILRMHSQVKTRILFLIDVKTDDYARFEQGKLFYSNVSRTVNGKEKPGKTTRYSQGVYELSSEGKTDKLSAPIDYNMMMLYIQEPVGIRRVYSDNFQQWVMLRPIGAHVDRALLPDGNYSDYHYKEGICHRVQINHSLYSIEMELIQPSNKK